jgi:hypothetical protein
MKALLQEIVKYNGIYLGNQYPPVADRQILVDNAIRDFWFKDPDKMLEHQSNNIITRDHLQSLTCF